MHIEQHIKNNCMHFVYADGGTHFVFEDKQWKLITIRKAKDIKMSIK